MALIVIAMGIAGPPNWDLAGFGANANTYLFTVPHGARLQNSHLHLSCRTRFLKPRGPFLESP